MVAVIPCTVAGPDMALSDRPRATDDAFYVMYGYAATESAGTSNICYLLLLLLLMFHDRH